MGDSSRFLTILIKFVKNHRFPDPSGCLDEAQMIARGGGVWGYSPTNEDAHFHLGLAQITSKTMDFSQNPWFLSKIHGF